jgi:hypothetical protein
METNVINAQALNVPSVENPPLPCPLLPQREEREKNICGVDTQGGTHCARLPWAIIFRPSGAGEGTSSFGAISARHLVVRILDILSSFGFRHSSFSSVILAETLMVYCDGSTFPVF